jgi:hypothetical protein
MALSANTMRGAIRYLNGARKVAAAGRLVIWPPTTTPVYGNHIRPTSAPSGTAAKGDFYVNTSGILFVHDGTAFRAVTTSATFLQPFVSTPATLTATQSGSLVQFNTAAGQLYTLPTVATTVAGMTFEFIVDVTATSSVHRIACSTGAFLIGSVIQWSDSPSLPVVRTANGTTHLAWEGNGSTSAGLIGDHMWVTAISTTQWEIRGTNFANGTEITPFKTS